MFYTFFVAEASAKLWEGVTLAYWDAQMRFLLDVLLEWNRVSKLSFIIKTQYMNSSQVAIQVYYWTICDWLKCPRPLTSSYSSLAWDWSVLFLYSHFPLFYISSTKTTEAVSCRANHLLIGASTTQSPIANYNYLRNQAICVHLVPLHMLHPSVCVSHSSFQAHFFFDEIVTAVNSHSLKLLHAFVCACACASLQVCD